uniref:UspA domain-containing protein n=1 Tax=Triticum urartu TaxID=4572 RepID=A0A8R7JX25_TRIUA
MWAPSITHTCHVAPHRVKQISSGRQEKATTVVVVLNCSCVSQLFLPNSGDLHHHPRAERGEEKRSAMAADGERWVGLAVDFSEGSRAALQWAADNLLRSGDNLLLLHVLKDPDYEQGETLLWEASGSPLIPLSEFSHPSTAKKYGVKPDAETLDMLNTIAKQKEVSVVSKVLFGDPREKLCQAIHDMPISSLVIGSRGLGKLKRLRPPAKRPPSCS